MMWSKIKKKIEDSICDELRPRIKLYVTKYTISSTFMVRGWITLDKEEIANFSEPDKFNRFGTAAYSDSDNCKIEIRHDALFVEKGEFSRNDFLESCWDFCQMNIEESLNSNNPIIKSLAIIDKRAGKRRLIALQREELHPLVKKMLELRSKTWRRKNPQNQEHEL